MRFDFTSVIFPHAAQRKAPAQLRRRSTLLDRAGHRDPLARQKVEEIIRQVAVKERAVDEQAARKRVGGNRHTRLSALHCYVKIKLAVRQAAIALLLEEHGLAGNGCSVRAVQLCDEHAVRTGRALEQRLAFHAHHTGHVRRGGVHREMFLKHWGPIEPEHLAGERSRKGIRLVIDNKKSKLLLRILNRNHHRLVEVARAVVQGLKAAEIVDPRPGAHGPAIVELPVERAVAAAAVAPPVLGCVPHALKLDHLREIQQIVEPLWQEILRGDIIDHLFVAAGAFLMGVKNVACQRLIRRLCKKKLTVEMLGMDSRPNSLQKRVKCLR